MNKIRYIYEDEDLLVCHKPSGVATEGAKSYNMDLVSAARNYLARKERGTDRKGKPPYVATVHRLDQPVEGVVVLAKTKKAATDIAAQIKNRKTDKYYYAFCYGLVPDEKGHLQNFLVRTEDGNAAVVTDAEKETLDSDVITMANGSRIRIIGGEVKNAELDYEVVARTETATLLRIKLLTGRFHQIRVQLSSLGYPIIGDGRYGTDESMEYSEKEGIRDVCLVSYRFVLRHPSNKKKMEFEIVPDNKAIASLLNSNM